MEKKVLLRIALGLNLSLMFIPTFNLFADNGRALAAVKKEQKVKDAVITDAGVLYAAVVDDGTKRNGYAEYLCQVLKENGAKANRVKIVKYGSSNSPKKDNAYGILLGESWCR